MSRDDTPEMVTITKKLYEALKDESLKLACLESFGVDNWQGYDDAMQDYHAERDEK